MIFQIEYAAKAVDNSQQTVVGFKCKDGIVMVQTGCSSSCWHGMAVPGLAADKRQIVARAKSEATSYESVYGDAVTVKELSERVASYVLSIGGSGPLAVESFLDAD